MDKEKASVLIQNDDCLAYMRTMRCDSVDAIVTDPPYGLGLVQKDFDTFRADGVSDNVAFQNAMLEVFKEAIRVAKPGAHLLAFGGTRTYHRLVCAIEDAGWEVRDLLAFVHGQGFPKSVNVSKYIDAHLGAERKVVGYASNGVGAPSAMMNHGHADRTGHANGDGKTYAITEPATEEAKEWDGFGTQLKPAIEPIVLARKPIEGGIAENVMQYGTGVLNIDACRVAIPNDDSQKGRFPSNFIHDGSSEVIELIPNSAASFFYCAKPSARERGLFNDHPTVKAIALMEYLVKLVTKEGQTVLDPFMGSGTTGIAAYNLDRNFIGIEKDKSYFDIAAKRLDEAKHAPRQMAFF